MSRDPVAGASGGLAFHELPTADLVMPYGAGQPAHPPAEPDERPPRRLREEWWRAWLVGSAAALMAAGVTAGLLFGAGRGPLAGGDPPATDMRSTPSGQMPSGQMQSIRYPAPSQAGGLVLDPGGDVAVANSLTSVLSNAEQFFAASVPGVAAVYRQPGTEDPVTGRQKRVSFVGIDPGADAGVADPAARLDAYLRSVASGHPGATFRAVPAGPGAAGECVSFTDLTGFAGGGRQTECAWATPNTVGVLEAPARDYDAGQLAGLIRRARPHLERS